MNLTQLENDWNDEGRLEDFRKLVKKKNQCDGILDKVFTSRTELFQKMEIDNVEEQRNLVDLINNVIWERHVSLDKTKTDLELCFTPKVQDLLENGKDDE